MLPYIVQLMYNVTCVSMLVKVAEVVTVKSQLQRPPKTAMLFAGFGVHSFVKTFKFD